MVRPGELDIITLGDDDDDDEPWSNIGPKSVAEPLPPPPLVVAPQPDPVPKPQPVQPPPSMVSRLPRRIDGRYDPLRSWNGQR
jgi:hypothetical protein